MKKVLSLLFPLLSEFKWFRKRQGGKWYRVYEKNGYNTIDGALTYWTRVVKIGAEIIDEENYL